MLLYQQSGCVFDIITHHSIGVSFLLIFRKRQKNKTQKRSEILVALKENVFC